LTNISIENDIPCTEEREKGNPELVEIMRLITPNIITRKINEEETQFNSRCNQKQENSVKAVAEMMNASHGQIGHHARSMVFDTANALYSVVGEVESMPKAMDDYWSLLDETQADCTRKNIRWTLNSRSSATIVYFRLTHEHMGAQSSDGIHQITCFTDHCVDLKEKIRIETLSPWTKGLTLVKVEFFPDACVFSFNFS
jgi:hypothetical protein